MDSTYIVAAGLLTLVVVLAAMRRKVLPEEPFIALLHIKPKIWWFCDSEVNARLPNDFGAPNSTTPNRGYLSIALKRVEETQGEDFDIQPLIGREATLAAIPNANPAATQLPPALWRQYVVANLLVNYGGLVMDGDSTLCVGPSFLKAVKNVPAAAFGVNPDEPVVSPATAVAPGPAPYVGWAKEPGHAAWNYAAKEWNRLVARGPQAWSAAVARRMNLEVFEHQRTQGLVVLRAAEGGRLANGKMRSLEDLFGRVNEPSDPKTALLPGTIYVSYDGDMLARRYEFNWFLKLSPEQIKESDFVWAKLAGF
jgi:hypothetical protein